MLAFYLAFARPDWAQPVQNGSDKLLLSGLDLLARDWHIPHVMTLEAEDLLAHVNAGVFKLMYGTGVKYYFCWLSCDDGGTGLYYTCPWFILSASVRPAG